MGLDMAWEDLAWASFAHDKYGPLDVVCRLGKDGDLDVTSRPRLEGDDVKEHPCLPQALAAFAYVNPATAGDGEAVSRDSHQGAWHQIDDDLAVAVASNGDVGGIEVGGRGSFLIFKGQLWLPNGIQTPAEREASDTKTETSRSGATDDTEKRNGEGTDSSISPLSGMDKRADGATVSLLPRNARKPRERRARIFGEEADSLIDQARSAGRRRV